ncbi:MAG: winged helix-turn-helix transcriptional regulator [Candidatus Bathyarchaeota archaeon]|jgi:predicted ArsR family transcriptional regulator|nr:winged helix-turn-helix transcriptional regulator [Candidatus Bathyarchaeota archaeon]MDP6458802.1 winged helix-turn-helix transcriptional regulator [Candidatus Bathyarchaeota archaeon]MDP7207834.1 winged helix-turn-helix transcriptional regulator [Candidatus Bathyarchaeota archaeon]MDP7443987.1 winged helix-turn-helix transcriptional regulator [Candidatus Bathyarchaeota archaeon]|tara:strand:+ start:4107 stop:4361 length:255 start_codon:yes stop_codon:yes gene_type:complete
MGSKELDGLRRAESQRQVLIYLIEKGEPLSSQEVADALGITVNAVNIALFNLNNKGLVERVSRGVYRYKLGPIIVKLLERYLDR